MNIDFNKHIWEGWTVGMFINEIGWEVELIMKGGSMHPPFSNKQELAEWCKSNQPYYKKKIAAVNNFFALKYKLR